MGTLRGCRTSVPLGGHDPFRKCDACLHPLGDHTEASLICVACLLAEVDGIEKGGVVPDQ